MRLQYRCADCSHAFAIDLTDEEARSSLRADRQAACPACGRRIGRGMVNCEHCSTRQEVALPHWHEHCNLFRDECHACGGTMMSPCIC